MMVSGLLLVLLVIAVIGLIIWGGVLLRRRSARASSAGAGSTAGLAGLSQGTPTSSAVMVQLMLVDAEDIKQALQSVAERGDPDTDEGLAQMFQEAALVALRHESSWTYGAVEQARGDAGRMQEAVGAWAVGARSAFTDQTTSNYQNRDVDSGYQHHGPGAATERGGIFLALTLAAAWDGLPDLAQGGAVDTAAVKRAVQALANVTAREMIRSEVVWSPDQPGELLSEDEAIMKYPSVGKL